MSGVSRSPKPGSLFVEVIENGREVFTVYLALSGLSTGFLAGPGRIRKGDQIDFDAELISQEGAVAHHKLRALRLQKI